MFISQRVRVGQHDIYGPLQGIETVGDVVNIILNFAVPFVGIILTFTFIWAGYDLLTSQGNPDKVKSARAKLTTAIIGVILLVSSFLVVRIVAYIFNLDSGGMF